MNKRVEKASYMTDIAKGSLQMAVNERDMAKVEGANAVQAEASAKVRKYEERIEMSKLTEKQDEELLGLAKERVASAKANMPTTDAAKKALKDARASDLSIEKRLSMYQAEVMELIKSNNKGPELEAAKERVGKAQIDLDQANEVKAKAKAREGAAKAAAEKVRLAEQKEQKEKHDAYIASLEKDAAYTKSEKKLKLTGKEQAEKKAIKDAHDLKVEKETGAKAAAKAEEDA